MTVPSRIRRSLSCLVAVLALGGVTAAAPCDALLVDYLDTAGGSTLPCLVDLQESGMCFRLPGMTLDAATRTLDAHLQARGVPRPEWRTTEAANGTVVPAASGDTLEIVIAADGPFATMGTCRIFPER